MLRPRVKKTILPARVILPAGQKLRLSPNPPRGPMAMTPNRLRWQPPDPCAVCGIANDQPDFCRTCAASLARVVQQDGICPASQRLAHDWPDAWRLRTARCQPATPPWRCTRD